MYAIGGFQPSGVDTPKLADFLQCHPQADIPLVSFLPGPRLDIQVDLRVAIWLWCTVPQQLCSLAGVMLPLGATLC